MNKNSAISAMILSLVAEGMDIAAAMDAVCGEGSYDRMVSDLYDGLRGK